MPSGLAALLDDIAVIAKMAAASIDDVSAAAGRAGAKAAGVVIDDTAVTPRYVTGFSPARELPIIARIAWGSLRNKLLIILPAALALSALLPWAMVPLLMCGGVYLCYEGVEKCWHALTAADHDLAEDIADLTSEEHEKAMIAGAIRTDFILSAEIMAIALAEIATQPIGNRAVILALVAVVITAGVYGMVGLIVKLDDIGLALARRRSALAQGIGRAMVRAMPVILASLSVIGVAAMMWVGGGIIVHGLEQLGVAGPAHVIHAAAHAGAVAVPSAAAIVGWLISAVGALVAGALIGMLPVFVLSVVRKASKTAP